MVLAPTVDTDRGQPRRARGEAFSHFASCTAEPKIPHLKTRKIKGGRNSWFTSALLLLPRLIAQSVPSMAS